MITKKSNMTRVIRILEAFRQHHRDMLVNEALVFLHVAENDGMQMSDLQDALGISQAAVSRNVNFLSKHGANTRDDRVVVQPAVRRKPPSAHEDAAALRPQGSWDPALRTDDRFVVRHRSARRLAP